MPRVRTIFATLICNIGCGEVTHYNFSHTTNSLPTSLQSSIFNLFRRCYAAVITTIFPAMKSTIPICYQIYDSLCTYTAFHGAEGNTQKTTLNWICILFSRKKAKLHFSSVQAKKYEQSSNHTHIIPRFVLVIHTAILWYNSSVRLPLQG